MMRLRRLVGLSLVSLACLASRAEAQATTPTDTVLRRAQRLVADGQGSAGRALVDSVVQQAATQPARLAEALFWRAALAEQSASAERDYQRVTVEHALSPWSGEALLRLGQLAYARGERTAALKSFERLVVEQAETPLAPVGYFWKGRVLLEQGETGAACDALREANRRAAPTAFELRNQVEFYAQRCRDTGTPAPTPAPTTTAPAPAAAPSAAPSTVASGQAPVAAADNTGTKSPKATWSLQVSAHQTRAEAAKAARTLANRGYAARVDGTKAPYRVRIGTYATEAEAKKDQARAVKKGLKGARVVKVDAP
jgi:tetratricopeptide (TPR) repeat protein